ncbi:AbrB/MazE/SpoVT family DNA-binding domain-containing protein [Desulfoscipio gibsoniae]|uniref:Growth regulator n=1 Tax=Desulfoscipio gibsoniae DSM 7213 TaxID=767817 RepID=R4KED5_9FIRM|nr:AbrB/MazE/SpoVT family DNA-binding domain-containing protein [Desulfoscipio gibsoniae]AGL00002.1 growth regulator [Desulfoscipio gibsoniae DSM 7213]
MYGTIQKWGNSQAIRLPKAILEMAKLNENDKVEIKVQDGNLIISPVKKHKTLQERIAEYNGDYKCSEWDTGKPVVKRRFNGIYTRAR